MCSTNIGSLKVSCRIPVMVYLIVFTLCEEKEGRDAAVYYGDSGRTAMLVVRNILRISGQETAITA